MSTSQPVHHFTGKDAIEFDDDLERSPLSNLTDRIRMAILVYEQEIEQGVDKLNATINDNNKMEMSVILK